MKATLDELEKRLMVVEALMPSHTNNWPTPDCKNGCGRNKAGNETCCGEYARLHRRHRKLSDAIEYYGYNPEDDYMYY